MRSPDGNSGKRSVDMDDVGPNAGSKLQIAMRQTQHMAGSAPIMAKAVKDHAAVSAQVLQVRIRPEQMHAALADLSYLSGQNFVEV
jgi:hypothetical protein